MQLPFDDPPEFPPRHRIGIKERGLVLRPNGEGPLARSWALRVLIPFGRSERPLHPFNNARSDKLGSRPWRAVHRKPCRVPASGFWEPEKPGRTSGQGALVLLRHEGREALLHGGLVVGLTSTSATGEITDSYTVIITDANATIRVHDRMPAILSTNAARQWLEPGPLPPDLLAPYPAEARPLGG